MIALTHSLLQKRSEGLPDDLRADPQARLLVALAAGSSACFGAAVGSYVGGFQILYNAVKMPLYFMGTLAFSFGAMHLFVARHLPARKTLIVAIETIALTAVFLGALAPIAALVSLSCPKPSAQGYRLLILLLTCSVATAGVAGVVRLHARLCSWRLTIAWTVIYQFVGAQAAWLLKPWVGHTLRDDRFLPLRENLHGNFYESVWMTVRGLLT